MTIWGFSFDFYMKSLSIFIETLDHQDIKPITFLLGTLATYDLKHGHGHPERK